MKTILKVRNGSDPEGLNGLPSELKVSPTNTTTIESKNKRYEFDHIYLNDNLQILSQEIYPILDRLLSLSGRQEAIVAYGVTSSGKTHTMNNLDDGIINKSLEYIFSRLDQLQASEDNPNPVQIKLKLRCIEVYMERCKDLLPQLTPRSKTSTNTAATSATANTFRMNLKEPILRFLGTPSINSEQAWSSLNINSVQEAMQVLLLIHQARKVSSNKANDNSSRSHLLIFIDLYSTTENSTGGQKNENCGNEVWRSQLIFGDLAGSERYKSTGIEELKHKQESGSINRSLHTFHNVIHAIRQKNLHVPVRDSKLTQLLSKCLIGSGELCLIVTVNMDPRFHDETVHVLEFAAVVRQVEPMKSRINTGKSSASVVKKKLNFYDQQQEQQETDYKSLLRLNFMDADEDWESAIEDFIMEREARIREEMTTEHAQNSDQLRNLYENLLEDAVAETEDKANRKLDVLVRSYEEEVKNLRGKLKQNLLNNEKISTALDNQSNNDQLCAAQNTITELHKELKEKDEEIRILNERMDQLRIQLLQGSVSPIKNVDDSTTMTTPKQKYQAKYNDNLVFQGDICSTPTGGKSVVFDSVLITNNNDNNSSTDRVPEEEDDEEMVTAKATSRQSVTPKSNYTKTPQSILSKTGLLSAFKLKPPTIPIGATKSNMDLDEDMKENAYAQPKNTKRVKLRAKKAIFDSFE